MVQSTDTTPKFTLLFPTGPESDVYRKNVSNEKNVNKKILFCQNNVLPNCLKIIK